MSQEETLRTASGGLAQVKHVATSLLPLALFVTGALGYEQLSKLNAAQPTQSAMAAARQHTLASTPEDAAATATTNSSRTSKITPSKIIPSLRDERSLLDLAVSAAPQVEAQPVRLTPAASAPASSASETGPAPAALPEMPVAKPAAPVDRFRPLKLTRPPITLPGTYAIVRGLNQNAQLSHGLPVGEDAWLVDGTDLDRLGVAWLASSQFEPFELDVIILSSESRVLSRDKLQVTSDNLIQSLREAAAEMKPAVEKAPASAPAPVAPAPQTLTLTLSPETVLQPGRGSLINLEISPAEVIPPGAYVILRGLPEDTALSRGFLMGPETWLLSISDLKGLEVRVPAKTNAALNLDARLLSPDGQLLAGDKRVIATANQSQPRQLAALPGVPEPRTLPSVPAAAQPAARAALIAPAAKPQEPVSPNTPPATASVPPASPAPQDHSASETIVLSRGRKMLDTGNIAIARQLLERAAVGGSREAAMLLASSFDPAWLRKTGVLGIEGDAQVAERWTLEAQRLNSSTGPTPAQAR